MGTLSSQSTLVAVVVLALVVPTALSTGTAGATAAASGSLTQGPDGQLQFSLDADSVGNDSRVVVRVSTPNQQASLGEWTTTTPNASTYQYSVPASDLPEFSLAKATVRVTGTGSNATTYLTETLDLRYLELTDDATFEGGTLVLQTGETAGIGDGTVTVAASTTENIGAVQVMVRNGTARVAHDSLAPFLTPPTALTLTTATDGPTLGSPTNVDLRAAAADDHTLTVIGDGVSLSSPLLVGGQSYDVTVTTKRPSGRYVLTQAVDGDTRTLVVSNPYITGAKQVTVAVNTSDGTHVLSHSTGPNEPLAGTVAEDGRSVTVDSTLPGESVSLVLLSTRSGVHVIEDVRLSGRTLQFPVLSANRVLDSDGTYEVGISFADGGSAVVTTGPTDAGLSPLVQTTDEGSGTSQPSGNTSVGLPDSVFGALSGESGLLWLVLGGVGIVLAALAFVATVLFAIVGLPTSGSAGSTAPKQRDLEVRIVDGYTSDPITDEVLLRVQSEDTQSSQRRGQSQTEANSTHQEERITGGSITLTVPTAPVRLAARYNGKTTSQRIGLSRNRDSAKLTFPPIEEQIRVVNESGEPVSGARVDVSYEGGSISETTNEKGVVTLTIPVSATDIEVTARHERFESNQRRASTPADLPETLRIVGKTGTLRIATAVDGDHSEAVEVTIDTADEWLRERIRDGRAANGDAAGSLPVGEYELIGTVDLDAFGEIRKRVVVKEGQTTEVTLDVPFEFALSAAQRDELAALRADADDLIPSSRLDTAIHRYYASVAEQLADTVESVPDAGNRFAETGVDPSRTVDGMLDAGRGAVSSIDGAMNTKHNVDLFSACSDMREVTVEWSGGYDLETFFDLADADRVGQRAELKSRLSEIESVLDDHRGEVSVLSPAQDVLDELEAYEREVHESDEVRNAAFVFAVGGFVDAVGAMFEQPRLLDRLNRTVY